MKSIEKSVSYVVGLLFGIALATFFIYGIVFAVVKTNNLINKSAYYSTLDVQINGLSDKHNELVRDLTHSGILPVAKERKGE